MIDLLPHDIAHGGEAVARHDGKTYFVGGAMPGEHIRVRVVQDKGNWARATLESVLDASQERVAPPCPHFSACGGCKWQFADYDAQLRWKRDIVAGQLRHLGRVEDPVVRPTVAPGEPYHYRNRMDFRIVGGKPALFAARSHTLVSLDVCLLLHPHLGELWDLLGPLDGVDRITLRTAATTGERLVIITGDVPEQAAEWPSSVAVAHGRRIEPVQGLATLTEEVRGKQYRISGLCFFQNNTAGAEALVNLVDEAAALEPDDVFVDGFAGGGLFSVAIGEQARRTIAVETSREGVRDLRRNLKQADIDAMIISDDFSTLPERIDEPWSVIVVDPPRTGLGQDGVDIATATMPSRLVYVSCDPASLGRDTRLLRDAGYALDWAAPVDMFPQTHHVETVARFVRDLDDETESA